ncbi:hypothetical protein [Flavobacterium subsaxonicum]|uniref:Uncharacterized protein n=1 Tax=Flavobacterium subsaxonicum WB 4.1-42 = DSM 21790 TaxID=1121898 RepID=A0A0A2MF08_9FLAO|nr:hypothetical protein [Flavobacterium subsaxonicum]KGO90879.1 hypothetical protein Q766_21035 [Flavobacterium subsaxonicum WB 4.1-42 = DSM 21790]
MIINKLPQFKYIMKIKFLTFFFLICNYAYCQEEDYVTNIFSDEFHFNTNKVFLNKNQDLVFFTDIYSNSKLKLGEIQNDSIFFSSVKFTPQKNRYFLRRIYRKDTVNGEYKRVGNYILKEADISNYQEVIFRKVANADSFFKCGDSIYKNTILKKFFSNTGVIINNLNSNEISVNMIAEDCKIINSETYNFNYVEYSESDKFLCLKIRDFFIFYYPKNR